MCCPEKLGLLWQVVVGQRRLRLASCLYSQEMSVAVALVVHTGVVVGGEEGWVKVRWSVVWRASDTIRE